MLTIADFFLDGGTQLDDFGRDQGVGQLTESEISHI
jgi:hypothetical protein